MSLFTVNCIDLVLNLVLEFVYNCTCVCLYIYMYIIIIIIVVINYTLTLLPHYQWVSFACATLVISLQKHAVTSKMIFQIVKSIDFVYIVFIHIKIWHFCQGFIGEICSLRPPNVLLFFI